MRPKGSWMFRRVEKIQRRHIMDGSDAPVLGGSEETVSGRIIDIQDGKSHKKKRKRKGKEESISDIILKNANRRKIMISCVLLCVDLYLGLLPLS